MNLLQAFDFTQRDVIAFTGAGGKTSAIFRLAQQYGSQVIITTTTHMGAWQTGIADQHVILYKNKSDFTESIKNYSGITLITGEETSDNRLSALSECQLSELNQYCKVNHIPLLIEADGARQRSLKAFGKDEPVIPLFISHIVNITGLQGIGKLLCDENVHHSQLFADGSGLTIGDIVSVDAVKRILEFQANKLSELCPDAKCYLVINQADDSIQQSIGSRLAAMLVGKYEKIVIASMMDQVNVFARKSKIAAIILAAGAGSRFGSDKPLALWRGKPMIEWVINQAYSAGLSPIILVGGHNFDRLQAAIRHLPAKMVDNTNWQLGQSSSIQAGLGAIPQNTQSVLFMMADQPQISINLLRALIEKSHVSDKPIIGPLIDGKRSSPMLFAKETFGDLMSLSGDKGGREILSHFPVEYIEWFDQSMAIDIDTPEDFQKFSYD